MLSTFSLSSNSFATWGNQWFEIFKYHFEQLDHAQQHDDLIEAFVSCQTLFQQIESSQLWHPLYFSDLLISENSTNIADLDQTVLNDQNKYDSLLYFTLQRIALNSCVQRIYFQSYQDNYPNLLTNLDTPSDFIHLCFKVHELFGHQTDLMQKGAHLWNYFNSIYEYQKLESITPLSRSLPNSSQIL